MCLSVTVYAHVCVYVCYFSLKTVEGNTLCVRSSVSWVKDLIRRLDAKSVRTGETSNL